MKPKPVYVDSRKNNAFFELSSALFKYLNDSFHHQDIIILCIGTDRSTGDSLGPLTGYKLSDLKYNNVHVYGTLDEPVHAKNLQNTLEKINQFHHKPFIISIDACLGRNDHIGFITVSDTPLKPGLGVHKDLPEVGDISITGIVNASGFMEFMVLQNTRLNIVMKMAELISLSLKYVLWKKIERPLVAPTIQTFQ